MIWCLGMHASGSTWLFNAARDTARVLAPNTAIKGTYAEDMAKLLALDPRVLNIVKTHHLGRAETHVLAAHATQILITVRDPRDAVTSLMQHMRHSFGKALDRVESSAAICAQFALDTRAQILAYEAGFTDDPATFDRLARTLGGNLTPASREALFAASRRAAIEAKIARLHELPTTIRDRRTGDIVDLDTQWHRYHAGRTGEIGRWRRLLAPDAARLIEQRLDPWMRQFGYLP